MYLFSKETEIEVIEAERKRDDRDDIEIETEILVHLESPLFLLLHLMPSGFFPFSFFGSERGVEWLSG